MRTAYKVRAYPTTEQAAVLNRTFGCVRVVWNRILAWRHARYHGERVTTSFTQANAHLTAMKASDELEIINPRHLAKREHNLARYQRRMARRQRGSANRAKAKAKVARAHRKVRSSRTDFLHRTSARLVRDHDVIVIEDLAVKNMVRNRKLAKAISDSGWGAFRRMLEYKAAKNGRHLIVIDRWYPSSKTCSACGHLLAELSLSTRTWQCQSCGTRHDRDINAAKNILAAGLAVSACGGDVRHSGSSRVQSPVKQESQPVMAGIPRL
ncbi:IS200/IS605 family element transposase accessory protein TnpB [Nonomuraea sp. SMC257]|uniref:IS200/IS605 family element transposase accessory protein TnpB n=1 Tax=Nonomuraea montanisoli TaxID=2741721 RepID=A0A7Y6I2C5_9ACTN|nr:RNA-guided endonuclease TnpB family protein [Nonomuraea montanisoli]NUW30186.1 IS200/IS605 family element transposase accessory protein TnpB [Nonomuraea montanisoli]